ncbi:hypothetical protein ACQCN2_19520 [Brevibacillus ginsengisoli]|uniref:hypothetical protein n=1 Tax=Brevibacillus ginsengisoli TaxID=363854 RepID=UPI003CF92868
MKMNRLLSVSLILLLGLGQAGCGSQQPSTPQASPEHQEQSNQSNIPSSSQFGKAIQDELNGLASIESDIAKGDIDSASKTFETIHEEYHASVLPPIKEKNAKLSEDMHTKFDSLDDAIGSKDKDKILKAIKVNRESLKQASKEMGISIQ